MKSNKNVTEIMLAGTLTPLRNQLAAAEEKINSLQTLLSNLPTGVDTTSTTSVEPLPASAKTFDNPAGLNMIKLASPSFYINPNTINQEEELVLIFESMTTSEIIDTISNVSLIGGNADNSTIANISSVLDKTSSTNLSKLSNLLTTGQFLIKPYVPLVGNGTNGATVYFDSNNQNIIIESININNAELVEWEIVTQGSVIDATI